MKAQRFKIVGSLPLMKEFWKELVDMGYKEVSGYTINRKYPNLLHIGSNWRDGYLYDDKYNKTIYAGDCIFGNTMDFILPQQWDEALEFCKEQLDDKYWIEESKVIEKPKFEVGKWYKLDLSGDVWYIKYKELRNNLIRVSAYINENRYILSKKDTNFGTIGEYDFKECSIEEIQQYLPDNHPDKIKPKTIELPFGDTMWTINYNKDIVTSKHGTINRSEIEEFIYWYTHSPNILGYKPEFDSKINFGCQSGTYQQILKIYNALTIKQ